MRGKKSRTKNFFRGEGLIIKKIIINNKRMKKIITLIMFTLLLTSCWWEEVIEEVVKKDFTIETKFYSEFTNETELKKTWKVNSTQDLNISSQATWRVKSIYVKQWEKVVAGQTLAVLEDNIANYWISLNRAKNALDRAKINYETTENQLNKTINDISIWVKNLRIDENNSSSSLEIEKINNSLRKIDIDFDNLQVSNIQTVNWFYISLEKDYWVFDNFLADVIDFVDKQFWYTNLNEDANDWFEDYFWAKNREQKNLTESLLVDLINYKNIDLLNLKVINTWNIEDLDTYINKITTWYNKIDILLSELEKTFDNSITSVWSLSSSDILTKKATINWYQSTLNMNNWAFVWLKNGINSFTDTFERSEASLLKQIELLEADKRIYIKWLDVKLEIDESTLNEAFKNKELTLKSLKNIINDAQIGYNQAYKEYQKLTIKSPINWVIWNVWIDVGQEISNAYKTFTISNTSNNEINISFNKNELEFVKENQEVIIKFDWVIHNAKIFSISKTPDANLKYNAKVILNDWINITWNIVSIQIPVKTGRVLLPINILKINNSWIATINILENWEIQQLDFKVGSIYWDKIQVLDELDINTQIIMSYVDNFDKEKFILKVK